jgi:uncharacterized membrane protein
MSHVLCRTSVASAFICLIFPIVAIWCTYASVQQSLMMIMMILYLTTLTLSAKAGFHNGRVKYLQIVTSTRKRIKNKHADIHKYSSQRPRVRFPPWPS